MAAEDDIKKTFLRKPQPGRETFKLVLEADPRVTGSAAPSHSSGRKSSDEKTPVKRLGFIGKKENPRTGPIFIVHGHDEMFRLEVENMIHTLELKPVVLFREKDGGGTIIEKLENLEEPAFVLVLVTPDDLGGVKPEVSLQLEAQALNYKQNQPVDFQSLKDSLRPRARQNVILELGYFMGLMTRQYVKVLVKGVVELPSDLRGIVYVEKEDHWKNKVAKEMLNLGIPMSPELIADL